MSKTEIPEDIVALARKIGKPLKPEQDLTNINRLLKKMAVKATLGVRLINIWVMPNARPRAVIPVTATMDRSIRSVVR